MSVLSDLWQDSGSPLRAVRNDGDGIIQRLLEIVQPVNNAGGEAGCEGGILANAFLLQGEIMVHLRQIEQLTVWKCFYQPFAVAGRRLDILAALHDEYGDVDIASGRQRILRIPAFE